MKSDFYYLDIIPHNHAQNALRISPVSVSELESLWPLDPALRQTTDVKYQHYFDTAQNMHDALSNDGVIFGMYGEHNYSLIGFSAILNDPEPEVAHYITDENSRSMGYGTIGKVGLAAFAFEICNAPAVTARSLAVNSQSIASLRKAGFSYAGTEDEPVVYDKRKDPTHVLLWRLQNPDTISQPQNDSPATNISIGGVRQYLNMRAAVTVRRAF